MKGFLIKDFKTMLQRKKFLVLYLLMAVPMAYAFNYTFCIYYFSMLAMIMAFSTLSYDSFDNGMAYLMTMPDARKNYVKGKYLFFSIVLLMSLAFSYLINAVASIAKYNRLVMAAESIMILPIFLLFCSIMVPIMLKFGAEKGRLIFAFGFGCISVAAVAIGSIAPLETSLESGIMKVQGNLSPENAFIAFIIVAILGFVASLFISIKIMKTKEF
ncbi:MAG: ABC-2 transporter permease [Butyrivibrio sp.]|nr:ABC-2 transporter permease [Butyrivibrio sp.]